MNRVSNNSSPISTFNSTRPNNRNGDDSPSTFSNSLRSLQRDSVDNAPVTSNSLLRPVQRNGGDSPIIASSYRSVQKPADDNSSTASSKPSSHSTPIQKVFVTQLTTPQVMKASPDGMNMVGNLHAI